MEEHPRPGDIYRGRATGRRVTVMLVYQDALVFTYIDSTDAPDGLDVETFLQLYEYEEK